MWRGSLKAVAVLQEGNGLKKWFGPSDEVKISLEVFVSKERPLTIAVKATQFLNSFLTDTELQ